MKNFLSKIRYIVAMTPAVIVAVIGIIVIAIMGLLCIIGLPLTVQWARTLLFFVWILQEYFKWLTEDENVLDSYFEENRLLYDTLKMMAEGRGM